MENITDIIRAANEASPSAIAVLALIIALSVIWVKWRK